MHAGVFQRRLLLLLLHKLADEHLLSHRIVFLWEDVVSCCGVVAEADKIKPW
jgi:hypothetical protein